METNKKNYFKYAAGFIFCLLFRLIPFRAPNIEPILATQMPFSRIFGSFAGFLFGFFSIIVYDILTSTLGMWTLFTATAYGLLGLWATSYFKNKKNNSWSYVKFAFMGTIFFDAVTGLSAGPLFFHESFSVALAGQIPFTLLHLLGNCSFAFLLSPAIYNLVANKKENEIKDFIHVLQIQKI